MKPSKKNKARIIAFGALVVILGVIGYILYPKESKQPEYIFDNSHHIPLADVEAALTPLPIAHYDVKPKDGQAISSPDDPNPQELLYNGKLINSRNTLKYFKYLEYLFKAAPDMADHFEKVRAYLFAHFSPSDAQLLFDTYQNYLKCEMSLTTEFKNLSAMTSAEEAIALLEQIQASRRAQLGAELADTIFGADVKAKEYALRRAEIVNNKDLNGSEKEMMIRQLNQDMWGEDAQAVEKRPEPYNRYSEKLDIYQKDLDALNPTDRQSKVQEFREEFFPPEVVEKMDAIDKQMADEKAAEKQYHEEADAITGNPDLTDEEKNQQINNLQNKTFGDQADEFRRREAIEKGRKAFIKEHEGMKNQTNNNAE
ncbi:MAG: lipase secretion chaperone [Desulfobacteraceae bacterium]|nr:lipase secretion chaperone [Desulfobacteraceae bacterium]